AFRFPYSGLSQHDDAAVRPRSSGSGTILNARREQGRILLIHPTQREGQSRGAHMTFDPKVCRKHSARCAEMARSAPSPQHEPTLSNLARSWAGLAIEIERNIALRDDQQQAPKRR